jgi:hypothetical protein
MPTSTPHGSTATPPAHPTGKTDSWVEPRSAPAPPHQPVSTPNKIDPSASPSFRTDTTPPQDTSGLEALVAPWAPGVWLCVCVCVGRART